MDQLIIAVIILAISGISTLIQKKRQRQGEGQSPPAPPSPRQRRPTRPQAEPSPSESKPLDWEEQLRRLLEGEPAAPEPKPSPPSPPLVLETRASPPPPLPASATPQMVYTETEEEAARSLAPLTQSAASYDRASHLQDLTAARLREASGRTDHPTAPARVARRTAASPALAAALAQLRQPQTVQQAIITSLILGPPKALASGEN